MDDRMHIDRPPGIQRLNDTIWINRRRGISAHQTLKETIKNLNNQDVKRTELEFRVGITEQAALLELMRNRDLPVAKRRKVADQTANPWIWFSFAIQDAPESSVDQALADLEYCAGGRYMAWDGITRQANVDIATPERIISTVTSAETGVELKFLRSGLYSWAMWAGEKDQTAWTRVIKGHPNIKKVGDALREDMRPPQNEYELDLRCPEAVLATLEQMPYGRNFGFSPKFAAELYCVNDGNIPTTRALAELCTYLETWDSNWGGLDNPCFQGWNTIIAWLGRFGKQWNPTLQGWPESTGTLRSINGKCLIDEDAQISAWRLGAQHALTLGPRTRRTWKQRETLHRILAEAGIQEVQLKGPHSFATIELLAWEEEITSSISEDIDKSHAKILKSLVNSSRYQGGLTPDTQHALTIIDACYYPKEPGFCKILEGNVDNWENKSYWMTCQKIANQKGYVYPVNLLAKFL